MPRLDKGASELVRLAPALSSDLLVMSPMLRNVTLSGTTVFLDADLVLMHTDGLQQLTAIACCLHSALSASSLRFKKPRPLSGYSAL